MCFVSVDAGEATNARVKVVDTSAPHRERDAATFTRRAWNYGVAGWLDDTTMLFGRVDKGDNFVYFTFDLDNDHVASFDMPTPGSPYVTRYDAASGTYRIETTLGVTFYDGDGAQLADVPCRQIHRTDRTVVLSGARALVTCRSGDAPVTVSAVLVDLESGEQQSLASFEATAQQGVRDVYGYEPLS